MPIHSYKSVGYFPTKIYYAHLVLTGLDVQLFLQAMSHRMAKTNKEILHASGFFLGRPISRI
jgi:hypothetical protein